MDGEPVTVLPTGDEELLLGVRQPRAAVARCFIQNVADAVVAVALGKEKDWKYALPDLEGSTATITIGMDGTCLLLCE
jgi:hypothetical protein